jgi:L-malate glycosyltransferase
MMRIAVLTPILEPWARQVITRLCELGHAVHVIDFEDRQSASSYVARGNHSEAEDVARLCRIIAGVHKIHSAFRSGIRYFTACGQVGRICKECNVDVLLSMYGGGWGTMAYLSGFRPCAIYVVGSDVLRARSFGRFASARALNGVDSVFVNGEYLADRTRVFAPRARVIPLLIGVNTDRFIPRPVSRTPLKVICTRKFRPVSNNQFLVQGLAELKQTNLDLEVRFTSAGPELSRARAMASRLLPKPLADQVAFLGGVSDESLLENLQSANVFVSLARSDGTSTAMLEAMSCGLFPVVSDIPQNRAWVTPELDNGVLVPLDRPKAVAEALLKAYNNPDLLCRAGAVNRQLILDRADSQKTIRDLSSHLEIIVKARRK